MKVDGVAQIDLAHVHPVRHRQDRGSEVEDARDSRSHHPIGDVLCGNGRRGDHPDGNAMLADDPVEVAKRAYVDSGDDLVLGRAADDTAR